MNYLSVKLYFFDDDLLRIKIISYWEWKVIRFNLFFKYYFVIGDIYCRVKFIGLNIVVEVCYKKCLVYIWFIKYGKFLRFGMI